MRYDVRMRLFGLEEANAYVPMLLETFTRVRRMLERDDEPAATHEVRHALEQLEQLGIEVKAPDGLVDFRSMRDGEVVYLCWKFPEAKIEHWHRIEAGFSGRRRIEERDGFEASWAN
jgi:hypothetical protein